MNTPDRLKVIAAVVLSWCLTGSLASAASEIAGQAQVSDADTVYIGDARIRLSGVDAPETDQICLDANGKPWSCGVEAKHTLEEFTRGRSWSCQPTGFDRYGRYIAICKVGGEDISSWLVRNGWGLAFRRYSEAYVREENEARAQKRGLWSGAFIAPWDWRHRDLRTEILGAYAIPTDAQRNLISPLVTSGAPNPSCVIKANLRNDGCIYHIPGGHYYVRLNMDKGASRRWFCSEADARAAGCRRSSR
jgi:endonuclease YncB( thermonuclease family)